MKKLLAILLLAYVALIARPAFAEYIGDFVLGDTITWEYNTLKATDGSDLQRTAAGTASCIPNGSTTELTAGVTDSGTTAFDSSTGLNKLTIVASSGNGYAVATDYVCTIRASTLNAVTVSYGVVAFSIENRSNTRGRIKDRGSMVSGSTTTVINLGAKISASHIWQGMAMHDVTTNEDATICDTTDNGSSDTASVSGFVTTPGATDGYEIVRTGIPATCIPAVPGSGLPAINASTGAVTVEKMGQSVFTAITDKAASNFNTFFDNNGAVATTPTIQGLYNAATTVWTTNIDGTTNAKCALAVALSVLGGNFTQSGSVVTYKESTNTNTRLVGTIASTSRSGITITCPP